MSLGSFRVLHVDGNYRVEIYIHLLRPISTKEKFPRTENFPKISLLKVENFQLQNFFPTENLCRPIIPVFQKIFFPRKIFLSGNGRPNQEQLRKVQLYYIYSKSLAGIEPACGPAIPVQRSTQLSYRGQLSSSNHKSLYILLYFANCADL